MQIGLGLGLTNIRHTPRPDDPSLEVIKSALGSRRLIEAKYEGADIVAAPYALFRSEDGNDIFLLAVVLRSSNVTLNSWEPQQFDARKVAQEKVRNDTFLPSQSFDPSVYGSRLIGVVDLG